MNTPTYLWVPRNPLYLKKIEKISKNLLWFGKNCENLPKVTQWKKFLNPSLEVTETQTCMTSFYAFVNSTQQVQPLFEEVVRSLHPVSCIISDGFLFWTQDSADKLGIPWLVFYGMNIFSMTMYNIMGQLKPHVAVDSDDEAFVVPGFPRIKLTGTISTLH
ncbi:hypothetical protein HanXRQr2_Chr02g0051901 [Helianthus annuus]|uniref:Putative UDP-glucuronosyl/UDP-glucosyltransferase n=1 Tax=Helianthus annuus TaxID=4232 RepID=A0A251VG48_HELAN|nr:hypothetical protein HanXRQr2_Chr02g0051901 [Helianthus annuus]KAJ0776304.1 hypothetical protein HanLR1_Chr02g0044091 [Helianthus annuus]